MQLHINPVLDYLRNEAPDNFQSLQEMLQRIVPGVQKVGVRRAKVMINRQRLIEKESGLPIPKFLGHSKSGAL